MLPCIGGVLFYTGKDLAEYFVLWRDVFPLESRVSSAKTVNLLSIYKPYSGLRWFTLVSMVQKLQSYLGVILLANLILLLANLLRDYSEFQSKISTKFLPKNIQK